MTMLAVQMFLLLLAAFLAGAILACFIRRTFFRRSNERAPGAMGTSTAPSGPAAGPAAGTAAAAAAPRPLVGMLPTGEGGGSRFSRALTDAPPAYPGAAQAVPSQPSSEPAPEAEPQPSVAIEPKSEQSGTDAPAAVASAAAAAATSQSLNGGTHEATAETVAPAATAPPSGTVSVTPPAVDDLTRIRSIDEDLAKNLNRLGITRFAEIAEWRQQDIRGVSEKLGLGGRVFKENWIEQAQILSKGGSTNYTRRQNGGNRRFLWDQADGADSIQSVAAAPAPAHSPMASEGRPALSSETAALRSVRSEALVGAAAAKVAGQVDDLKRIRGIGVLIETKLNAMGIRTYDQIANWTGSDVASISEKLDFKGRIERENWIEQARILASGGQTDFSRRIYRG